MNTLEHKTRSFEEEKGDVKTTSISAASSCSSSSTSFRKDRLSDSDIFQILGVEPRDPNNMLSPNTYLKIVAPMVRYSKLPFRLLCKKWGADLTFTPMIISDSFVNSKLARDSDFATCLVDRPVIAQFAASDPIVFAKAAQIVNGVVQGVDLNCGCPQKWAMKEGLGAALSAKPGLVQEMVSEAKKLVPDLPVSIKIRLHKDRRVTHELLRRAERAGIQWITVHGRTAEGQKDPVDVEAIKLLKDMAHVPVIYNGDVNTWREMEQVHEATKVDGIMCARGALANPAMFSGHDTIPQQCITDYVTYASLYGGHFAVHTHHLQYDFKK